MTGEDDRRAFGMVDVAGKPVTRRIAVASGCIRVGAEAFELLRRGALPKGDALALAAFAAVHGAKLTPQLLPLCHPIGLNRVLTRTELEPGDRRVWVHCLADIAERTGVEMEALTGASTALLTIWDLVKPVDAALCIETLRLVYKEGGRSGRWTHPEGLPETARSLVEEARR